MFLILQTETVGNGCALYPCWLTIQSTELFSNDASLNVQDLFFFRNGVSAYPLHERVMARALKAWISFFLILQGCKRRSLPFLEECWESVWVWGHLPALLWCVGHCVIKGESEQEGIWFCRLSVLCPQFGEEMLKYQNLLPALFPGLSQKFYNYAERAGLKYSFPS